MAALTGNGVGTCGADDNQAQAGHLIAQTIPGGATGFHIKQDPISSEEQVPCCTGSQSSGNGVMTVTPLAIRGRDGGAEPEAREPGAPLVRRLTEMECERLQGFPDNWTDGQCASARYRQLGNSVAVPVVEWIARRLVATDRKHP